MSPSRPAFKPENPRFSCGPCAKRPGWSPDLPGVEVLGRSHRSDAGREGIASALRQTKEILSIPETHQIVLTPGSDTGAFEMALWSLLGCRGVDVLVFEHFARIWADDICTQLGMKDARVLAEPIDFNAVDFSRDVVFVWNGATSGTGIPDGDWIADTRDGLTLCDATSAVFCRHLPWEKLDVASFSWQKVVGGEAGHGMLVLSPRAIERLRTHKPPWGIPKLFRLAGEDGVDARLFAGWSVNTPSLLCVLDYLDALDWMRSQGGLDAMIARVDSNHAVVRDWIASTPWASFQCADARWLCNSVNCIKVDGCDAHAMADLLEAEDAAYDIRSYRHAPRGLRIWSGPTIEAENLRALLPWLEWAYETLSSTGAAASS